MMDAEALELSKENIQPLKQGRRAGQLGLALQAQTNSEVQQQLLKERYNYELLIRMYEGDDPLQPRYDYVAWIEQTYPKHGRETNLVPLLEDTIATFKDDPRYRQDERFIKLIVKYIETQLNRLEIYQLVYSQGIGTMCAYFYKAWAEQLDLEEDFKRANHVYQLGLANGAQPTELLEQAHMLFQLSVGRRMLSTGSFEDCGAPEDEPASFLLGAPPAGVSRRANNTNMTQDPVERCVLGKLKRNVGSVRPAQGPAGTLVQSRAQLQSRPNASQPIYQDAENPFSSVDALVCVPRVGEAVTGHFHKSEVTHKENTLKAGTWNKAYNKKQHQSNHHHQAVLSHTPAHTPNTPSFRVHIDEDCDGVSDATPIRPVSDCPSALKTKRMDTFSCPMAIFEPPDPTVRPMYPKQKVYAGGREFQLEEIMAAHYLKKYYRKQREEELRAMGLPVSLMNETPEVMISTPQIARRQCTVQSQLMTPIYTDSSQNKQTEGQDVKHQYESEVMRHGDRRVRPFSLMLDTPKRLSTSESADAPTGRQRVCSQVKPLPLLLETPERSDERLIVDDLTCQTPIGGRMFESVAKEPTPDSGIEDSTEADGKSRPSVFHKGYVKSAENVFLSVTDGLESSGEVSGERKFNIFCDGPQRDEGSNIDGTLINPSEKKSLERKFNIFCDGSGAKQAETEGEENEASKLGAQFMLHTNDEEREFACTNGRISPEKKFNIFCEDPVSRQNENAEEGPAQAFSVHADAEETGGGERKFSVFCDGPTSKEDGCTEIIGCGKNGASKRVTKFTVFTVNEDEPGFPSVDGERPRERKFDIFCDDPILRQTEEAVAGGALNKPSAFTVYTDDKNNEGLTLTGTRGEEKKFNVSDDGPTPKRDETLEDREVAKRVAKFTIHDGEEEDKFTGRCGSPERKFDTFCNDSIFKQTTVATTGGTLKRVKRKFSLHTDDARNQGATLTGEGTFPEPTGIVERVQRFTICSGDWGAASGGDNFNILPDDAPTVVRAEECALRWPAAGKAFRGETREKDLDGKFDIFRDGPAKEAFEIYSDGSESVDTLGKRSGEPFTVYSDGACPRNNRRERLNVVDFSAKEADTKTGEKLSVSEVGAVFCDNTISSSAKDAKPKAASRTKDRSFEVFTDDGGGAGGGGDITKGGRDGTKRQKDPIKNFGATGPKPTKPHAECDNIPTYLKKSMFPDKKLTGFSIYTD